MTAFLDAAIFMYAGGAPHPLKSPCAAIIRRLEVGTLRATTSAEVVQQILHRFIAIRQADTGIEMVRNLLAGIRPVLSITHPTVRRLPELAERYRELDARDLLHVATCIEHGIDTIISPDRGFDAVTEIRRLDPFAAAA